MTDRIVVPFQSKQYVYTNLSPEQQRAVADGAVILCKLPSAQLIELFNLVRNQTGESTVARFKDTATGQRRTWVALNAYQDVVEKEREEFEASPAELAAQKTRPAPAAIISDVDKAQIADQAKAPEPKVSDKLIEVAAAARTEPKPKKPRAKSTDIKMPNAKQMARKQHDGSYVFKIAPKVPRSSKISDEREELLGHLVEGGATWASIKALFNKDDFRTVTTVTMFAITLGYGLETQPDGTIVLSEPLGE